MSEYLLLDGAHRDTPTDGTASEEAQQVATVGIRFSGSHVDSGGSIALHISNGLSTLPVEKLAILHARSNFLLETGLSIRSFPWQCLMKHSVSWLPRSYTAESDLCHGALYNHSGAPCPTPLGACIYPTSSNNFFAYDLMGKATGYIPAIISLISNSAECVHVDKWPNGTLGLDLRDCLASVRNLRQLSIGQRGGATSPTIHFSDRSVPESVVLDETNVLRMVHGILSDASNGVNTVVGSNISIYCVAPGTITPYPGYLANASEVRAVSPTAETALTRSSVSSSGFSQRPPLSLELVLEVVAELRKEPAPFSFMGTDRSPSTLTALASVSRSVNSIAIPALYHCVWLVETKVHVLFCRPLSRSPRWTYLASLVNSFFAAVPVNLAWRLG
ncbi:hypothetical protein M407DRAFT_27092 [Tulasnella calospora MUT 4182]|uniref:Uncharacterized protein n=1 Tax=Tulasnella calospora MUT 4182 TaxID=1051891 RepID=A0A0C3LPS3_9AGAM|nr:hypothetical protein M407DRAFT_27092 [Tulasnella calospora MUT 4182]